MIGSLPFSCQARTVVQIYHLSFIISISSPHFIPFTSNNNDSSYNTKHCSQAPPRPPAPGWSSGEALQRAPGHPPAWSSSGPMAGWASAQLQRRKVVFGLR